MLVISIFCLVLGILLCYIAIETYDKTRIIASIFCIIFIIASVIIFGIIFINADDEERTYTVHSSKELVITDSENHIEKTINELVIIDDNDRIYIIYLSAENLSKYKVDDKTIKISLNDIDKFKQIELNERY